jgi:DNA-binding FadR family transcriptional regulator
MTGDTCTRLGRLDSQASGRVMDNYRLKSSEVVAREIEREIKAARWPVGKNLGSAADLEQRFGVSKPTMREAVRILENRSLAAMRRGPGGGLIVAAPSETLAAEGAALYLEYRRVSLEHLSTMRRSLELTGIELAVANLDEDGISRLRAVIDEEIYNPSEDSEISTTGFHLVLAELSGNPALSLFVRIMVRIMNERFERRGRRDLTKADLLAIHLRHKEICEAVVAGDGGLARHRMQRHLEEFEAAVLGTGPRKSASVDEENSY